MFNDDFFRKNPSSSLDYLELFSKKNSINQEDEKSETIEIVNTSMPHNTQSLDILVSNIQSEIKFMLEKCNFDETILYLDSQIPLVSFT
jgi:hypothetical protein